MKNLVLCFDRARPQSRARDTTNAARLFDLLDQSVEQLTWYRDTRRSGRAWQWRKAAVDDARAAIAEAYEFLADWWQPGDRIYLFGAGRGAYCAQALTRLLGTVGLLPDLMDYVLATYAVPRTARTQQDWQRVTRLAAQLSGQDENTVPVTFLGLWDSRMPALPRRSMPDVTANLVSGRHAVAIDGPSGARLVASERVEEVWFRGAHCDVAGGPAACTPLAAISLDWMLQGAIEAGIAVHPRYRYTAPAPSEFDALAGSAQTISVRGLPADAVVHSSVDIYLREHPEYWRRLPSRVLWADTDWAARGERLVRVEPAAAPAQPAELAAVS